MKRYFIYLLFSTIGMNCYSQNFQLKLSGNNNWETKTIDSLNYISNHKNIKSILEEINNVKNKLTNLGYIENKIITNNKENDSTFSTKFELGKKTKSIHIYVGENSEINKLAHLTKTNDTLILPYQQIEFFLEQTIKKLEQNGYALAKLKLVDIKKKKNTLTSKLEFILGQKRQLNEIVIKNENNKQKNIFPNGHLIQLNKKYKNKTFNEKIVNQIHDEFEKYSFINQIKHPEILFSKDTTKVYIYLEKRKSNNFDGFIGFSNNENKKLTFNGYLDITLENMLRAGEQFNLLWKSDGDNQKTFNTSIDIPYVFKSKIGLKAQLNIFKQDSTFQNTKNAINIGYLLNYNTRLYLGYQTTESSDIQNTNTTALSDYKNNFYTLNFEYNTTDYSTPLFQKKTSISATLGSGKRNTNEFPKTVESNKQYSINALLMHNLKINDKNYINLKIQTYLLQSKNYITNELYRFGGLNNIRGFAENSLQANFMTSLITEYRYLITNSLYLHTITDICLYQDKTKIEQKEKLEKLLSLGIGLGLQTKTGLLKFSLSNGTSETEHIKLPNTTVSISYNVKF